MTGLNEFLNVFGDITLGTLVTFILAGVFLYFVYKKVQDYLVKRHDAEQEKNAQLQKALEAVHDLPQIKTDIQNLMNISKQNSDGIKKLEDNLNRRDVGTMYDRLVQSYRYYTSEVKNPHKAWTRMECAAFRALFKDYENAGGDSFAHSVIYPAMELLSIVEMDDEEGITALMKSRN